MATHSQGDNITKTVSMTPLMLAESDARALRLGFRSYSAYIQKLIAEDLAEKGDMVLRDSPASSSRVDAAARAAAVAAVAQVSGSISYRPRRGARSRQPQAATPVVAVPRRKAAAPKSAKFST